VIKAGKLRRYLSWQTVKGVGRIPLGMMQAVGIVRRFHPDVAFTSGGYVAVPAGLAARLNGVPLLMHQQDVPPNLSNRLLAPLATKISVAFEDSRLFFPASKTLLLGNPVRSEILSIRQVTPQQAREKLGFDASLPLLLVTGGSQGARRLNRVACEALPEILQWCQVLHISGNELFAETQALSGQKIAELDEQVRHRYRLVSYMSDEMPLALQAADLVVCRAGAATLSELAVLQKPSILVPLPPAIGRSPQEANAAMLERWQAAEMIANDTLDAPLLVERTRDIITQPEHMQQMQAAIHGLAKPMAAQDIVETIVHMARGSNSINKQAPEQKVLSI
ncbi:MAG TPA: UDP-N-acetylglucosamine--N-acetylmuramyl-(pentapeptide) pyrophosphoryl-undecaprenol N-acetylglucosamine transferase, partial [Ktedonobacteraceae bacterium]